MVNTFHCWGNSLPLSSTLGTEGVVTKTCINIDEHQSIVIYVSQIVIRDIHHHADVKFKVGIMELVNGVELPYKGIISSNIQDVKLGIRQICVQLTLEIGQNEQIIVNITINMPSSDLHVSVEVQGHR